MPRYLVCMTGASGAVYGLRLLELLAARADAELHLVASPWGERVVLQETGRALSAHLAALGPGRVSVHAADDLAAPVASGSFRLDGCVVVPCSIGTASAIASGACANLVHRAGVQSAGPARSVTVRAAAAHPPWPRRAP